MERKHLYLGGAVLGLFAVVATVFIVTTSSAQTQTACTYSISPDLLNVTLEPGKQATSASVTVNTNSATGCVGIANVQVWDTPNQAVWPWASVWPVAMSDVSTATFTITFSPPATLTSTYDALFRVLLSDNTVAATNIIKFNVTPASCSGMNLSISPSTITKTNVPSEPVQLTYSCVSGGSVPSLTVQICPPGASGTQCETVNTLTNASSGTVTIPTSSYTTSGSYLVRTCMNDSTCATGTNSVSFNLAAGTTCSSGQYWCPQVSGSTQPAGCYVTCPTAEPAKSCANGEKCSSNSWCQNGSQCYYPTGELTCVAWPSNNTMGGGNYAECPVGTTECSPTDTSCISVGQIVPYVSGKWCRNGMQYYSTDGKT